MFFDNSENNKIIYFLQNKTKKNVVPKLILTKTKYASIFPYDNILNDLYLDYKTFSLSEVSAKSCFVFDFLKNILSESTTYV